MSAHATHRCRNCGAPAMPGQPLCAACAANLALDGNTPAALPYEAMEVLSDDLAAIVAEQVERIREKSETIVRLQQQIARLRDERDNLTASQAHLRERAYARGLEQQLEGLRRQLLTLTGQDPLHTRNGGLLRTIRRLIVGRR